MVPDVDRSHHHDEDHHRLTDCESHEGRPGGRRQPHPAIGVTALDDFGEGKTSLLEAIAWSCRGRSFRHVPDTTLVRSSSASAVIRTEIDVDDHDECEGMACAVNERPW